MLPQSFLLLVVGVTVSVSEYQDASIYAAAGRLGITINYTDHSDWSNLGKVLHDHGFIGIGTVCVTGAWLMYRQPEYGSFGPNDYDVASGGNHCVEPGNIESMQPLGQDEAPFKTSLNIFKENYFAGLGVPMDGTRGPRFFESLGGVPRSFVFIGKSQWTIQVSKNGTMRDFCFATNFDPREELPICLVPDLVALGKWEVNEKIVSIAKGCKRGAALKPENIHLLEDCRYFGERRPDLNEPDAYRPRVLSQNLLDKEHKNDTEPGVTTERPVIVEPPFRDVYNKTCPADGITELIQLLSIRLNHDFTAETQLLWPTVPEHIWRTEMLDLVYDIAMTVVPANIVPPLYLMMMREFMVHHLSNAWKTKGGQPLDIPEYFIGIVTSDLDKCAQLLDDSADVFLEQNLEYWIQPGPKSMFEAFIRWRGVDIVVDTTWVLSNLVLGVCHHLFNYSTNFWANFVHVFNDLYLKPVINDWTSSGVEDQFILGGFDYDSQYERLAAFATNALQLTPNFQPFDRPLPPREKKETRRRRKA